MRIVIIAAGPVADVPEIMPYVDEDTYVIGVDAGMETARARGVECDVLIGDFDSLGYTPRGAIVHPPEKDFTDLELALIHAKGRDASAELLLFGATGGRLDMTLQNVYLLKQFPRARLVTNREDVRFLGTGHHAVEADQYHYLSFIPLVPTLLTLRGVKYPLTSHEVPVGGSLTVSNEWTDRQLADVTVETGEVIMIRSLSD